MSPLAYFSSLISKSTPSSRLALKTIRNSNISTSASRCFGSKSKKSDTDGSEKSTDAAFDSGKQKKTKPKKKEPEPQGPETGIKVQWKIDSYCPDCGKYVDKDAKALMREACPTMWRKYMRMDDKLCPLFLACRVKDDGTQLFDNIV